MQKDTLDHLAGKHIGLMWFSPDCKHFSKAKGGKPVARNIRDLAWIIPGWIERIQKSGGCVDVVLMENVEEFAGWGPLIETERGLMPCPARKGETFAAWCGEAESMKLKRQHCQQMQHMLSIMIGCQSSLLVLESFAAWCREAKSMKLKCQHSQQMQQRMLSAMIG